MDSMNNGTDQKRTGFVDPLLQPSEFHLVLRKPFHGLVLDGESESRLSAVGEGNPASK